MATPYEILRVPKGASAEQLKHAYRCLVKLYHPDLFASGSRAQVEAEKRIRIINAAYSILSKAVSREKYDATVKGNQVESPRVQTQPVPEQCSRCGKPTGYWRSAARKIALCSACTGRIV